MEVDVSKKMIEELFMERLPMGLDEVGDMDALAFENLKKRKDIVEVVEVLLMQRVWYPSHTDRRLFAFTGRMADSQRVVLVRIFRMSSKDGLISECLLPARDRAGLQLNIPASPVVENRKAWALFRSA